MLKARETEIIYLTGLFEWMAEQKRKGIVNDQTLEQEKRREP